jgi:hypothetical protein
VNAKGTAQLCKQATTPPVASDKVVALGTLANEATLIAKIMSEKSDSELNDELRPEYDLHKLLKDGVGGKYAARYQAGTNLVLLEPKV